LRRSHFRAGIGFARKVVQSNPGSVTAYLGLAFLLLERAESYGEMLTTTARDRCEAIEILTGLADYCEKVSRGGRRPARTSWPA
jgi:hypothetical protein